MKRTFSAIFPVILGAILLLPLLSDAQAKQSGPSTSRMSFSYQLNADVQDIAGIKTIEGIYSRRLNTFWLDAFFSHTTGKYKDIAHHNSALGAAPPIDQPEVVTGAGLGLSLHGNITRHFTKSDKVFEIISASLGYYSLNEQFRNESFNGFGLKTDASIILRSSGNFSYGFKVSYQLANVVKKEGPAGQSRSQRSLLLTWLSAGIDVSLYF